MRPHKLDLEKCDGCGLCEEVCGRGFFTPLEEGMQYRPTDECIACGHCAAVCPNDALVGKDGALLQPCDQELLPTAESLFHLLRSRRSTRRFKSDVPDRAVLDRLVEAARYAPTGTNQQDVRLIMVTDAERIAQLRGRIMSRYRDYQQHLKSRAKRLFLETFVDKRLGDPQIRTFLDRFIERYSSGHDPLFHYAPVVAFLYTGKAASTPKDDCCLALFQMVLMAERLGLGSCLLGTAEAAFARTPSLNDLLGIPRDRTIHAVACFGIPRIPFKRLTERKPLPVHWI